MIIIKSYFDALVLRLLLFLRIYKLNVFFIMIKKLMCVVLGGLLCLGYAVCNTPVSDSLRIELSKTEGKGLQKEHLAEIYLRLSEEYESVNIDSAIYFTDKGLDIYKKPEYGSWMYLRLLNSKATYYYSHGEFEKSKTMYLDLLSHASKMKERDYDFEATVSMSVGVVYRKIGITDSTLFYYNQASDYAKISADKSTLSSIYYNIGAMYFASERYGDALPNAEIAAKYAQEIDDVNMYMYSRILLAAAYARMGKYTEGAEILKDNIEMAIDKNFIMLAMSSFGPLLSNYQLWGKKDSVKIYMDKYGKYVDEIPAGSPTALEIMATRASIYNWMGEYQKSLDILLGNPQLLSQISYEAYNRLLYHNYEGLGDYKKAFEKLLDVYAYTDSLMKTSINTEMSELNAKLNVNAKELEISRLENEHARQKAANVRLGIYMGVVIVLLFIIILVLQHKRKIQQKEAELISAKRYIDGLENERKRLAKDLHDGVCNDLLGVIMHIKRNNVSDEEKQNAIHLLEEIRCGVRDISHELMPPSFQFTDLDEMLNDYFAKTEEQTGIHIEYTSSSDKGWEQIPHKVGYEVYRIMQEMMSNIVKYANVDQVQVKMKQEMENLKMEISYDGKWDENDNKNSGIGMRTIDDRLKTIGGVYHVTKDNGVVINIDIHLF